MKHRVDSITVEGFKGFADPKTLQVEGKHIFVFGPNGSGKSSVIEAIRWCLLGQAGRPEETVRNQFYTEGNCQVTLGLRSENGVYRIRRVLTPGSSKSDSTAFDPQDRPMNPTELLPSLTSLGPGEGTYVIFGGPSQLPSRRRPLESTEISDFGPVIYGYLHLEEVQRLIEALSEAIETQKEAERKLGERIEAARGKIVARLEDTSREIEKLVAAPPWGTSDVPTEADSQERIRRMVTELAKLLERELPPALGAGDYVKWAQNVVQSETPKEGTIRAEIAEHQRSLEQLRQLRTELAEKNSEVQRARAELCRLRGELGRLPGADRLAQRISELLALISGAELRSDIASRSLRYLAENKPSRCPVCGTNVDPRAIAERISEDESASQPHLTEYLGERRQLEDSLRARLELENREDSMNQSLQRSLAEQAKLKESLADLLGRSSAELTCEDVDNAIEDARRRIAELQRPLDSEETFRREWGRKLRDVESELWFHRLRDAQCSLQRRLGTELRDVSRHYEDLVELRGSLEEARSALLGELLSVLRHILPPLSDKMTQVFQHLTHQASFDRIVLDYEVEPDRQRIRLQVRVGTSGLSHK
jgi:DNA repair exonuclease SbcCD ATPase subunit